MMLKNNSYYNDKVNRNCNHCNNHFLFLCNNFVCANEICIL
jgi:hypothetical protein